jgi:hypothetical protein
VKIPDEIRKAVAFIAFVGGGKTAASGVTLTFASHV